MEYYPAIKLLHVTTALTSLSLFALRVILSAQRPYAQLPRPLRIAPHVNDSILLASAITLVWISHQYPGQQAWLNAKIFALLLYIGLGSHALKRARDLHARLGWGAAALGVALYIVAVARTRAPWPFSD